MSEFKKQLIDRMIRIYGFEHQVVIDFVKACESNQFEEYVLEIVVKLHEEHPWIEAE